MRPTIAALAVLLAACGQGSGNTAQPGDTVPATPPPSAPAARSEYTPADSVIEVGAGQRFSVVLPSNPTTGYAWRLADSLDAAHLRRVDDAYEPDQPRADSAAPMAGAGGRERFTFAAVAPGESVISMVYGRGWEPSPDDERARFRVRIR